MKDAESLLRDLAVFTNICNRTKFAADHITDAGGDPWQCRKYQWESLESREKRKVHCDGRDVGKTAEIEITACWAVIACPDTEMLIATQTENHLFPLMNRLLRRFETIPDIVGSLVEKRRSPSWYFRFSSGFTLWGRIAGPHGVNFQGMHVDWQIVDEAQEMTESSWAELFQALNGGGRRWVYGVPNGLRNTFYRMTQMKGVEHFNWPSSLNPAFTAEKEDELCQLYGGRNTPGYIHRVLGQHGAPRHAVFSLDDYLACVQESVDFENIALLEDTRFEAPADVPRGEYYLGCDLGYAQDPSEFVVYKNEPPHLVNVLRVHLEGVNYARQQEILIALDRAYDFVSIGIDAGNSGRAVAHQLMALGEAWCGKIQCIEFGGTMELSPLADGSLSRRRVKEFMTELLQRRITEHTVIFPPLPDRESQYASHTFSAGNRGQILYEKGNDHIIDADRCAFLAHHLETLEADLGVSKGIAVGFF